LLETGAYEPATERVLRQVLTEGGCFVDLGANEGYFTALACLLVGDGGRVVSVEPQAQLRGLVEVNASLNGGTRPLIVTGAVGGPPGTDATLFVWPGFNSGASNLLRTYSLSRRREVVPFIDLPAILDAEGIETTSLMKVDVEGFEGKVVRELLPFLRSGRVRRLLIDYHAEALSRIGEDARIVDSLLVTAGFEVEAGSSDLAGYVLYRLPPR
jgi:FkbM family methyltransferase